MDENSGSWKRLSDPTTQITPTPMFQGVRDPKRLDWIKRRAFLVFAAYRKDDFADPESFLLQLGMVFEKYADPLIERVTDPRNGIQKECKFPPSIAEVVEFCEETKRRENFAQNYDARSREQLAERARLEAEGKVEGPEHRARVVERVKNELRSKGFSFEGDRNPARRVETAQEVMARYGLTLEQWDALKNLPEDVADRNPERIDVLQ